MKKFKSLARRIMSSSSGTAGSTASTVESEVLKYSMMVQDGHCSGSPLEFWLVNENAFPRLSKTAQDIVSAPASEAYCERVFSLCGDLSSRKRNRTTVSLEMQSFLKLNKDFI